MNHETCHGHLEFFHTGSERGFLPVRPGCLRILSKGSTLHLQMLSLLSYCDTDQVAGLLFWAKSCLWLLCTRAPFQVCQRFCLRWGYFLPLSCFDCMKSSAETQPCAASSLASASASGSLSGDPATNCAVKEPTAAPLKLLAMREWPLRDAQSTLSLLEASTLAKGDCSCFYISLVSLFF